MEVEDCDTDGSLLEAVQPASKRIAALVQKRPKNFELFIIQSSLIPNKIITSVVGVLQNFVIIVADKGAAGEHIRIGAFQAAEILLGRKIAECRIGFGAGKSKIACVPDAVAAAFTEKTTARKVISRRRNEQCFLIVIENTSFHVVLRALTQYNKEKSCFVTRNYKIGKCNNKRNIVL